MAAGPSLPATLAAAGIILPMTDLCLLTATELIELYRKKELSPVEVTKAAMKRIEDLNPVLNAFCFINSQAIQDAKASETRWMKGENQGLLDGVPVSIK